MNVRILDVDGPNGPKALTVDLKEADHEALDEVREVVQKGALNIKNDWRNRWSGHPRIGPLPSAVTYDTAQTADKVGAEIGPDPDRRGAELANLIEYEFGGIHSAPIPGGAPALEAEAPRFEKALGNVLERLLQGRR